VEPAHVDFATLQGLDFVEQHPGVDDDAVADRARQPRVEDSRRDEVEAKLLVAAHDRVPGVVAALKADDEVGPLGEQVGHLSLALVAPLGADYHGSRHGELV
jgi:hypothetical protein